MLCAGAWDAGDMYEPAVVLQRRTQSLRTVWGGRGSVLSKRPSVPWEKWLKMRPAHQHLYHIGPPMVAYQGFQSNNSFALIAALHLAGCGTSTHPDVVASTDGPHAVDTSEDGPDNPSDDAAPDSFVDAGGRDTADVTDGSALSPIPMRLALTTVGAAVFAAFPMGSRWDAVAQFFRPIAGVRSRPWRNCTLDQINGVPQVLSAIDVRVVTAGTTNSLTPRSTAWVYNEYASPPLVANTMGVFAVRGGAVGTIDAGILVPSEPSLLSPTPTPNPRLGPEYPYRSTETLVIRWTPEPSGEVQLQLVGFIPGSTLYLRCYIPRSVGQFEITPDHWSALGNDANIGFGFF